MQTVELTQTTRMPLSELYALLSDHNRLGAVLGAPVKRIREGRDSPNGVGSVRSIGFPPLGLEETVVGAVVDKSIDYKITRGGWPVKNHHGRLTFRAVPDGRSEVQWRIQFDGALPGSAFLVKQLLGFAIGRGLKSLA